MGLITRRSGGEAYDLRFSDWPAGKLTAKDVVDMQATLPGYGAYRLGELFCGAGGMALGASQAQYQGQIFEHVWAVDIDPDSCRTIQGNGVVRSDWVRVADVRELEFDALPAIDGLVFGFPCNDFSAVGERRGITGEYGDLYTFGVAALNALNPDFFVAENVSGLSSVNKNSDFSRILRELSEAGLGYRVVENLYRFEEYGIPQNRHRYVIVGFRNDLGIKFKHPLPNYKAMSASDALSDIPADASNNERTAQSPTVVERLKLIKPGQKRVYCRPS